MTYRVYFTDMGDNCPNQKILEANNPKDIFDYMTNLGHTDVTIEII